MSKAKENKTLSSHALEPESLPSTHFPFLDLPMASTSSIYKIQGASFLARLNRSLTLAEPTPENTSTKSEPAMVRKGTSASVATALANSVLPVPGGPTRRAPLK